MNRKTHTVFSNYCTAQLARVVCALYVLFSHVPLGYGEITADPRLLEIQNEVASIERELLTINERAERVERELAAMKKQGEALRRDEQQLLKRSETLATERARLENEIHTADREIKKRRELAMRRLRALYVSRRAGLFERIALGQGAFAPQEMNVARNALFLSRLRTFDQSLIDQIERDLESQKTREGDLYTKIKELDTTKETLAAKRREFEALLVSQKEIVQQIKRDKQEREAALARLRAQSLRLEVVVKSLTTGGDSAPVITPPQDAAPTKPPALQAYQGVGLYKLSGSLVVPVVGRIVKSYGAQRKQVSGGYRDQVSSRGIELLAADGAPVTAIAPARVAFVGQVPGLDLVVILDHGQRYHSLYGFLKAATVSQGSEIAAGTPIGTVGAPRGAGEGNLYFEIRKAGDSINPLSLYTKSSFPRE
jgi:septal ring factor EnvC (AmiA/AmiB activator)